MSLETELEPKLAEIENRAKKHYASVHLGTRGFEVKPGTNQVDFDAVVRGEASPIWEVGATYPQPTAEDLAREQTAYNNLLQQIEDLKYRFRTYYALGEPTDFSTMKEYLGGHRSTTFPSSPGGLTQPPPYYPPNRPPPPPTAMERMESAYADWVKDVDGMINEQQWTGDAATSFHTGFLLPFHRATLWQAGYIRELGIAVQIYHDAITKAREDIKTIADLCIKQISPFGRDDGPSARTLGIVSLVASALALFPPLSLPAGAYGLGTGLISFIESEKGGEAKGPYEVTITGWADIPRILSSTWEAIGKLDGLIAGYDELLSRGLGNDLTNPNAFASPHVHPPRPDLANRADARAPLGELKFRPRGDLPLAQNAVVVELRELYRAGNVNLPAAAYLYHDAMDRVDDCVVPGALTRFFPRSIPKFEESRDGLARIFRDTRDSLGDAGKALVHAAKSYQLTDAERAELLRQTADLTNPMPTY